MVADLATESLVELLEALAPHAIPAIFGGVGSGGRSKGEALGPLTRSLLLHIEQRNSDYALVALERMAKDVRLAAWHNALLSAVNALKIARRRTTLPMVTPRQVSQVISNDKPANVADLAALTVGHLRDIASRIQNGPTNDYNQFWDLKPSPKPKDENVGRDAILSKLEDRLSQFGIGIPAFKEGYLSGDDRVDILVKYGGADGFPVPLEFKRDIYKANGETVWTALRSQLIDRYTLLPGADGHGIYVVLWFGGVKMPLSPTGLRPKSAVELEDQLRALLSSDESRIQIVVIDCTIPPK